MTMTLKEEMQMNTDLQEQEPVNQLSLYEKTKAFLEAEDAELIEQMMQTDKARKVIDARLVTAEDYENAMHMGRALAKRLRDMGWQRFSMNDLIGAANEGIAEAALRFEPTKGRVQLTKFTSYAYFWIRKKLLQYVTVNKTLLSAKEYEHACGYVPSTLYLDKFDDDNNDGPGTDHMGFLVSNEDFYQTLITNEARLASQNLLASMLARLPEKERTAYMLSVGLGTVMGEGLTVRQIAHAMNISIGKVSFLVNNAKRLLNELKAEYQAQFDAIEMV